MDPLAAKLLSINFTPRDGLYLGIIFISIIISAFFAACETSLAQAKRFKIIVHADAGSKKAKYALKNLDKIDSTTINMLININLFHIIPSTLATLTLINWMGDNLSDVASLISTISMTLLIFLFSEMLPKYIANKKPTIIAENTAIPLYIFGKILTPLTLFFRFIVWSIKKIFHLKENTDQITEIDFQDTIEDIQEEGKIEEEASDIIQAAVDFGDYTVRDVIMPIKKMVVYDVKNSARRDVLKFLSTVPYSRIPVYEDNVNNIIGILHVKKYLLQVKEKTYFNFKSILTKPLFVDKSTKIDDMLDVFQSSRTHIAIVKDYQKDIVLGMVTMEDVVEKLVGDIDEKNPPKAEIGGDDID